jgi:hypothetical protein
MALTFLPYKPGQTITAADLNALVQAIQDGTIFLDTTYVSSGLAANSSAILALSNRVTTLESIQARVDIREQLALVAGQSIIGLSKTPLLDSEVVSLAGVMLSKSGIPLSFVGDYSISGSTLTLNSQLAGLVEDGDLLIVKYTYGV